MDRLYRRDVTRERLLESQRCQAQRFEAIGRSTAGVAHDFNNLLAAICGFASLGKAAKGDAVKAAAYFAEIDAAGKKASELARQLLAVDQPDAARSSADLNDVVLGLASLLRQLMPPGVELRLELSLRPVRVCLDRALMEQVVVNLTVNGRDAIEDGGTITIRTSTDAPQGLEHSFAGESAWLQVIDTGSGIPADIAPRIFEEFFTTKPPETGTGLGLATVYGIVSESRGNVHVDTTVGMGTSMTVVWPAGGPSASRPVPRPASFPSRQRPVLRTARRERRRRRAVSR